MESGVGPITKIACIGEVMIELVTEDRVNARLNVAGDSYNTAVYLARRLGSRATLSYITALGTDHFSDRILSEMARNGIGTDHVERRADKVPGLYAIETDESGERSFTYWRSDSAARTLFSPPARVEFSALMGFDLVFLSGISLAILPAAIRAELIAALRDYRRAGGLVAYDSNHRPRLWQSPQTAREVNAEMWALADIALPSVDDEMQLFGEQGEAEVLARLRKLGLRRGALKRGAVGPVALDPDQPPQDFAPAPRVVDTTGAGDSFNAGFLAAIAQGASQAEAMAAGHALASEVVQHRGAIILG